MSPSLSSLILFGVLQQTPLSMFGEGMMVVRHCTEEVETHTRTGVCAVLGVSTPLDPDTGKVKVSVVESNTSSS